MKKPYQFIFLFFFLSLAITETSIAQSLHSIEKDLALMKVVNEREEPLRIIIYSNDVPNYEIRYIVTYNPQGEIVDLLNYIASRGSENSNYSHFERITWVNNQEFTLAGTDNYSWNVRDHQNYDYDDLEKTEEDYWNYLTSIEDPDSLVGRSIKEEFKRFFFITDGGGIIENKDSYITEKKYVWEGLDVLTKFPKSKLRIIRNTIFAKYGYRFKSQDLQSHFAKKKWYCPRFDNVDSKLTEYDVELIDIIRSLEKR